MGLKLSILFILGVFIIKIVVADPIRSEAKKEQLTKQNQARKISSNKI